MLYTKKGSYPAQLPHRIILSNGTSRTDKTTFTDEEIADAGYTAVENPPVPTYPQKLEWSGTGWLVRDPNESETAQRWAWIQQECERRLFETDYKVIKAVELGETMDPAYVQYRKELRDLYNNVNNIDPWNFQFPSIVIEEVGANNDVLDANNASANTGL